jgi:hypothetical protein
MARTTDACAAKQWLVQGDDVASGALSDHIASVPDVRQMARIAPDIVVLSMPGDHVKRLRDRFSRLVIEPNKDLIPPV